MVIVCVSQVVSLLQQLSARLHNVAASCLGLLQLCRMVFHRAGVFCTSEYWHFTLQDHSAGLHNSVSPCRGVLQACILLWLLASTLCSLAEDCSRGVIKKVIPRGITFIYLFRVVYFKPQTLGPCSNTISRGIPALAIRSRSACSAGRMLPIFASMALALS